MTTSASDWNKQIKELLSGFEHAAKRLGDLHKKAAAGAGGGTGGAAGTAGGSAPGASPGPSAMPPPGGPPSAATA